MASSIILNLNHTYKDIQKDWIYRDVELDIINEEHTNDWNAVQNSITNLFTFRKGDRILLPEYGNSLLNYVYEPINDLSEKMLRQDIHMMFKMWEPRVEIIMVYITGRPDMHEYDIKIEYDVPSLESFGNIFSTSLKRLNGVA